MVQVRTTCHSDDCCHRPVHSSVVHRKSTFRVRVDSCEDASTMAPHTSVSFSSSQSKQIHAPLSMP